MDRSWSLFCQKRHTYQTSKHCPRCSTVVTEYALDGTFAEMSRFCVPSTATFEARGRAISSGGRGPTGRPPSELANTRVHQGTLPAVSVHLPPTRRYKHNELCVSPRPSHMASSQTLYNSPPYRLGTRIMSHLVCCAAAQGPCAHWSRLLCWGLDVLRTDGSPSGSGHVSTYQP